VWVVSDELQKIIKCIDSWKVVLFLCIVFCEVISLLKRSDSTFSWYSSISLRSNDNYVLWRIFHTNHLYLTYATISDLADSRFFCFHLFLFLILAVAFVIEPQIHSLLTSMLATMPNSKEDLADLWPEQFVLNWKHNVRDLEKWTAVANEHAFKIRS
jgi:hypothetical protein